MFLFSCFMPIGHDFQMVSKLSRANRRRSGWLWATNLYMFGTLDLICCRRRRRRNVGGLLLRTPNSTDEYDWIVSGIASSS